MARLTESAREVVYPQLTRAQIDVIIAELYGVIRDLNTVRKEADVEGVFAYLVGYYTKRWGMPPAIRPPDAGGSDL